MFSNFTQEAVPQEITINKLHNIMLPKDQSFTLLNLDDVKDKDGNVEISYKTAQIDFAAEDGCKYKFASQNEKLVTVDAATGLIKLADGYAAEKEKSTKIDLFLDDAKDAALSFDVNVAELSKEVFFTLVKEEQGKKPDSTKIEVADIEFSCSASVFYKATFYDKSDNKIAMVDREVRKSDGYSIIPDEGQIDRFNDERTTSFSTSLTKLAEGVISVSYKHEISITTKDAEKKEDVVTKYTLIADFVSMAEEISKY